MKSESVFRGITAALLVSAASTSIYHRHKAEQAGSRGSLTGSPRWGAGN